MAAALTQAKEKGRFRRGLVAHKVAHTNERTGEEGFACPCQRVK